MILELLINNEQSVPKQNKEKGNQVLNVFIMFAILNFILVLRKRKSKNSPLVEQYIKGQNIQKEGFKAIASGLLEIAASINTLAEAIKNKAN